ncbi:exodeoxyribonuclease V subunit gamma [Cellulosimicrobium sp. CUA-896]|uniref:exodeoxyribonuclease V subunit gamma n=1 Tax=Cellulosimicrobium sp. CUA-896 TaxID=1517881 RepID=UPI000B02491F
MLHVHRSERADALVGPLARVLADPLDDPFATDVVAVPTRGVERWLAQRLSHFLGADGASGVCANVDFRGPRRLVEQVVADLTGVEPEDDPWRPERLAWSVLEVLDAHLGDPWAAPLARYVGEPGDEVRRARRLTLARRLAGLLVDYARQRPEVVRAWSQPARGTVGGSAHAAPDDLAWQPELWRRLLDRVPAPDPARRVEDAVAALLADPTAVELPPRLSVYGPTRLPEDELRVLRALAEHRDVHLWLVHPSPALWDTVAAHATAPPQISTAGGAGGERPRRADLPTFAQHPLLASTARDAVELQLRLHGADESHHAAGPPPATLLGALQSALRADAPDGAHVLDPADRSVQVLSCHGRARQVEVLRETLVGLFAADPTLQARDVIVLCPDVETFAPLVTASFGAVPELGEDAHPGQRLRVSLADRGAASANPVLGLLEALLRHADGRVTASEVLDLAASAPVRRRFRFSDDEIDRLRQWAVDAGVHWGEDGARRSRFGVDPRVRQGTWDAALDRILLGAAMADEDARFVGPALPLDDVGSTDVDLAGRLAELVARMSEVLQALDGVHPLHHWLDALDRAVTLLAEAPPTEAWQVGAARRLLGDVRAAGSAHGDVPLRLADVRAVLDDRLAGRPTRAGFRTGALTVCSLEPMRSVPHRVCACSAWTTASSRAARRRPATTCSRVTRRSASGTRAARTGRSSSTPSPPRATTSSSCTRAPTSAPAHRGRRPSPSPSCSTRSTAWQPHPTGGPRASTSSCATRCRPSTSATSRPARSGPPGRSATTPRPSPVRGRRGHAPSAGAGTATTHGPSRRSCTLRSSCPPAVRPGRTAHATSTSTTWSACSRTPRGGSRRPRSTSVSSWTRTTWTTVSRSP